MTRRAPVLAVLAFLLLGLLVASARHDPPGPPVFGRADAAPMPIADEPGSLSSTWYCAAGTATPGGTANLAVVVANVGDTDRSGTVTWVPTGGAAPVVVPVTVVADAVVSVPAHPAITAPVVSAIVELDGGDVAVEHAISGPRGSAVAPCAAEASTAWHLANGSTERDAVQVLALFNPFPDDAIVDIAFASEQGRDQPSHLQGLPVQAGSTTLVNVHDAVRRRAVTAASVVARSGRLVVDRVQTFDGSLGRSGLALSLAAPAPAEVWWFPDGFRAEGLTQSWHVYNPSDREAVVSLEVVPDEGDAPEPLDLTIAPQGQLAVQAAEIETLPSGVAHSSTIRSLNGVPVVAERAVDARRPAARRGWSSMLGAPMAARRWVLPVGEANGNTDEWIVVHNPGSGTLRVSIAALAGGRRIAVEGLQDLEIGPAGRIALRLGDHVRRSPLPILVEADGDVVVERDAYGVNRIGFSATIGIPLR